MTHERYVELNEKCREIRRLVMDMIGDFGVGHIGGSLSIVEALVTVYYGHMRIDPKNPKMDGRDRFVLSKGHAGPALYAVLADMGFFEKEMLYTLNRPNTRLPSHADMLRTPGVDMTTGSLGQGLSCAVGVAVGSRLKNDGALVYTILGDGESQEGQIWEAALYAASLKLDNLCAFTDANGLQVDGSLEDINPVEPLDKKWEAFGWHTVTVDGHDIRRIDEAVREVKAMSGRPGMVILKTVKGKGIPLVEAAGVANHNMVFTKERYEAAMSQLKGVEV